MKWISVNDKLPEVRVRVLIYGTATCGSCSSKPRVCDGGFNGQSFEFGEYECTIDVTHWMPIPSPPEQAQDPVDDKITRDILEQTYWKFQS